ncbi:DNA repair protein RAD5A [Silene latifolia]|uniref:DNA repair protein RAD5A n=1 Tax=Silene latifolia TaxID=37657 RepID=UPI003D77FEFA
MNTKVKDEMIATIRSVVGQDYSQMDIIRALHMANNDATGAINIIFDTPNFISKPQFRPNPRINTTQRVRVPSSNLIEIEDSDEKCDSIGDLGCGTMVVYGEDREKKDLSVVSHVKGEEWWFVGYGEISGMSTCKGRRISAGDEVEFAFPAKKNSSPSSTGKGFGRGKQVGGCSEIVRFSTKSSGEVGRIPNEWARCLLPLVRDKKIQVEGFCKYAPDSLSIMDTIALNVSVYINSSMFRKHRQNSLKATTNGNDESVIHPLPTLFKLLGITPFRKAQFTPDNLYTRKRSLNSEDAMALHASLLHAKNLTNVSNGDKSEGEESVSDADVDKIVGVGDSSKLEEMDPPSTLQCELRSYQKQALHWMVHLEKGGTMDEAATTLHPCWEAYRLADKRDLVVYLNSFSGEATTEFPSTLQMARGGILADAMGLGKTVMTIALLLANSERVGSPCSQFSSESSAERSEPNEDIDASPDTCTTVAKFQGFTKQNNTLISGGSLIVCPMTLLSQWKAEIETHSQPGSLSVYVHYGQGRSRDVKLLSSNDVVLTTYGVLSSECSSEGSDGGALYAIRWSRVVLDEAHTIKSTKSQISLAANALTADRRWCLTGTPIQNNLEDIYSLLRFLKVEPWGTWAWWNKLVQKPFEEGDERGLKLVQSILKPIMLRRTKYSVDREGRPILVLPPANIQVVYCELTEAEKDFYEALFKRSKVKFDKFVEQGKVLHNYASILELLLRLRQCCDHPFLVMSRGDTQDFADLDKLAKRFLRGDPAAEGEDKIVPSKAYIQEVVEELRKGEQGECPICLEAFEDAVLTPCAHRLCRECLLASWRNAASGLCPVCRKSVSRQELITAPTDSRFQVDVQKNWVESTKVSSLLSELENLRPSGSKSIVFSQWTAFLDLLEIPFARNNISFLRLDGTLNQQQRERVIKRFSEENDIMVLLMSLKAGGVGINLTAASNAFVLDPWWNPAVEEQAVMRIHRIGQTKAVSIKRFIIKGTVEERMEAVQARKQRLISGALTDQEVRSARIEELKMLFT